jgi:hypothetical protein
MHAISQLIVGVAELCEAEGRLLRRSVLRIAKGVALMLVAALGIAAGVALLASAAFLSIAERLGAPTAASLVGAAMLVAAIALAGFATRFARG